MKYSTRSAKLVKGSPGVYINKNDALSDEMLQEKTNEGGRELLYQTVVFSTPVLASKRIHENQVSTGKKLLFDEDDVSFITNGLKSISIGKSKNFDDIMEQKSDKKVEVVSAIALGSVKIEMEQNPDKKVNVAKRWAGVAETELPHSDEGAILKLVPENQISGGSSIGKNKKGRFETTVMDAKTNEYTTVKRSARFTQKE